ncbi:MAG TPA: putative lipid II flippase FtsW [Terriglobia bacterium]|nr:putative lipid II flippase FtsW [Terriglobia bacterium]
MARKLSSDKLLFAVTVFLVLVGVVMVFSASAEMANEKFHSPYYFLLRQGLWAALGLLGMSVFMHIDYHFYRKPLLVFGGLFVCALLLLSVFFLDKNHNTHRWFKLGFVSFQPSELTKISLLIFVAYFLEKRAGQINDLRLTLAPLGTVLMVFVGLVFLEPDLGTAAAIVLVTLILLWVAGLSWKYVGALILVAVPALFCSIYFFAYRARRLGVFWDPWKDRRGTGFQIVQSLIAVGTGGLFGTGLMDGKQKLFYLPEPHTDFIYAVLGEEFGLAGSILLLALFLVFLWRGLRISLRAPDPLGKYLGIGLSMMVICQAFINMSVVLSLLPTKGIPLPFVSYGGSSLLISLVGVGVLLNVSQHSN